MTNQRGLERRLFRDSTLDKTGPSNLSKNNFDNRSLSRNNSRDIKPKTMAKPPKLSLNDQKKSEGDINGPYENEIRKKSEREIEDNKIRERLMRKDDRIKEQIRMKEKENNEINAMYVFFGNNQK